MATKIIYLLKSKKWLKFLIFIQEKILLLYFTCIICQFIALSWLEFLRIVPWLNVTRCPNRKNSHPHNTDAKYRPKNGSPLLKRRLEVKYSDIFSSTQQFNRRNDFLHQVSSCQWTSERSNQKCSRHHSQVTIRSLNNLDSNPMH